MKERKNPNCRRCAVYTRKSNDEGLDLSFTSLEAQREAAEAYIQSQKSNGWVLLPQQYNDAAYSGGNLNRPAMKQLLADCEAGLIDIIVVYKIDRLSRSLADFTDLSRKFEKWGVAFVSITQQIDSSTSAGKMLLNLLMTFAEYERQISSERIRDKFKASKMKGMWMGGAVPLGYVVNDRQLIIDQEKSSIIQRIFKRYVECQSPKQIAIELNNDGVLTKNGREWKPRDVIGILHNCIYSGFISHKGEVYPGQHEAIIDKETWDTVQSLLGGNVTRSVRAHQQDPNDIPMLKGLLFCGHCGGPMVPVATRKNGRKYLYYQCSRDRTRAVHVCPIRQIPASTLEDAVLERLTAIFRTPELASTLSGMSGMPVGGVMRMLNEEFWNEATRAEKNRLVELLVAGITMYEDRMDIEVRTEGLTSAMEEIENESAEN